MPSEHGVSRYGILYHDVVRREDFERECGISYVSKEELLSESDIITIHAPLNAETKELIGEREIAMMKKTAIVVNTSRGAIINERALYTAIAEGRLGGAGLSVFSEEPLTQNHPFYKLGTRLPNVVLFPHMGSGTNTARAVMFAAVDDVIAALEGKQPKYVINKEVLVQHSQQQSPSDTFATNNALFHSQRAINAQLKHIRNSS